MQKNWYIIYTKPKCEKKVSSVLTKRKIENYLPANRKEIKYFRRRKLHDEPLFNSYVFVCLQESEVDKQFILTDGVLNFVYWKGKPAIISNAEIDAIRQFTSNHQNIRLEKTNISLNEAPKLIDGARYSLDGNVLTVKNTIVKINLPSIGFNMIAEIATENMLAREVSFGNKELLLQ